MNGAQILAECFAVELLSDGDKLLDSLDKICLVKLTFYKKGVL
jgi:hypothetical protein